MNSCFNRLAFGDFNPVIAYSNRRTVIATLLAVSGLETRKTSLQPKKNAWNHQALKQRKQPCQLLGKTRNKQKKTDNFQESETEYLFIDRENINSRF